jgi:hypothetical protein
MKKKEFKEGDLVMMFDVWHYHKVYNKLLPKWFGPFVRISCTLPPLRYAFTKNPVRSGTTM